MGKKFLSSVLERDDHVRGAIYQFKASDVLSSRVLRHRRSVEEEGFEVRLGFGGFGIIIYGSDCALHNFTEPLPITNLMTFGNWYD